MELERKLSGPRMPAVIGLVALCLVLAPVSGVKGQTSATLSFSPATATLYLNAVNTIELDLQISGAVDLQGFELTLTYDPEVVSLDSWAQGGMLSPTAVFVNTHTPGSLRLAIVQLGGTPPSGDGTLLRLSFRGVGVGTSAIQITEAELTNGSAGGVTSPQLESGVLMVDYDWSLIDQVTLTGEVSLQGQLQRGGALVQLDLGGVYQQGPYTAASLDQAGPNLDFGTVIADTYLVATAQPRYLNLTTELAKTVSVTIDKTALNPIRMVAGNAVWTDNVIDAADASLVGASYGLTLADMLPGETLDGDVNFDGIVDLKDLALVAGNFDLTAAEAYQSWDP